MPPKTCSLLKDLPMIHSELPIFQLQDQLRDPWALAEYLVTSDIRLVRAEFLWQLWRQQRSLPRRQEAEEEVVMCNGPQVATRAEDGRIGGKWGVFWRC